VFKKGREYGLWKIRIANFGVGPSGPALTGVVELAPAGAGFYEPHGLAPDGATLIFTAAVDPTKSQYYASIYTYDLRSLVLTKLAGADNMHFEQAMYVPSGQRISFMSGPFIGLMRFGYKTDLYLMDADGANRVRLTGFNDPAAPEYTGADTLMNKHSWHPDGTRLAGAYYIFEENLLALFVITFRGACGHT
jgi:dipeptidyl aminopeptidase/acylaminoacyl peptidase